VADGHLTYADAITAHKAQGLTVDRAFVLGSGRISRGWGYTALSRAREETRLYVGGDGNRAMEAKELGGRHLERPNGALPRFIERLMHHGRKELADEPEPPGIGLEL
jgi:hypothetical protein